MDGQATWLPLALVKLSWKYASENNQSFLGGEE